MRIAIGWVLMCVAVSMALAGCCAVEARKTPLDRTVELDEAGWLIRADFVAATGRMQVAAAEYYNVYGKLPAHNKDAGLPEPEQYRGKTLRSASFGPNGVIELVFDAKSGRDGGRIRLVPDVSHAPAMGMQWRCESPDYPQVKRVLPTCDYVSR